VGRGLSIDGDWRIETLEIVPVSAFGTAWTIGALLVASEDLTIEAGKAKAVRAPPCESSARSSSNSTTKHGQRAATDRARSGKPSLCVPQPRRRSRQFISTCGLRFPDPIHHYITVCSRTRSFVPGNHAITRSALLVEIRRRFATWIVKILFHNKRAAPGNYSPARLDAPAKGLVPYWFSVDRKNA
jgi:hypothetical protein